MRVSKAVKDYIEKQVNARYPKTENELTAEQVKELVNKANQEMLMLIDKAKKEISNQIIERYGLTEEMGKQRDSYYDYKFCTFNSPLEIKANTDKDNRRKAEAIKEFAEMVAADYPEMEFYLHNLVKEMGGE